MAKHHISILFQQNVLTNTNFFKCRLNISRYKIRHSKQKCICCLIKAVKKNIKNTGKCTVFCLDFLEASSAMDKAFCQNGPE